MRSKSPVHGLLAIASWRGFEGAVSAAGAWPAQANDASSARKPVKNAARMTHTFSHRYGSARVKFVVNRFDGRADIGQTEIEKVVGMSAVTLPSDYRTAVEALNTGRPIVLDKDQRMSRAIRSFASELAGVAKPAREVRGGMLSRRALRRA